MLADGDNGAAQGAMASMTGSKVLVAIVNQPHHALWDSCQRGRRATGGPLGQPAVSPEPDGLGIIATPPGASIAVFDSDVLGTWNQVGTDIVDGPPIDNIDRPTAIHDQDEQNPPERQTEAETIAGKALATLSEKKIGEDSNTLLKIMEDKEKQWKVEIDKEGEERKELDRESMGRVERGPRFN